MTRILVTASVLAGLLWPVAATADTCRAPRMLVVLDKSSSMAANKVGDRTRWEVATAALSTVVKTYQSVIDFGLMIFPDPANVSKCVPGVVKTPIGTGKAQEIIDELATPPPLSGSWTPIAQTLSAAGELPELNDEGTSNSILLITDGDQWCSPKTSAIRFLPVDAAAALAAKKIKVYVVGFSQSADTLTLNKMAAAADTKISPSCDPTSEDSASASNCYYQANSPQELLDALQSITRQVSSEVCDGIDNDCDGQVDEELTRDCVGAGGTGKSTCAAGIWSDCVVTNSATEPATEECDNQDNDQDGQVDEDLSRTCTLPQGGQGRQTCTAGTWSDCQGESAAIEICDGIDNDGDEVIDGPSAVCEGGGTCVNGRCVSATNAMTPDGAASGCDCRAAAQPGNASAGLWLLVPLLALLVRARRRAG